MPTFTVHAPPRADGAPASPERFLFVRDGFHGWAFLLGPFWLIRYRLWLALVLYAIGMVALIAGLAALRASGYAPRTLDALPDHVLLDFPSRASSIPQLNLADAIAGRHLERVRGRTVFIGATSEVLHDVQPTPYEDALPAKAAWRPRRTSTFASSTRPTTNMPAVTRIAMRWLPPVPQVIAP